MLEERITGSTLAQIGARHNLTPERVRQVIVREGTERINALQLELVAAKKRQLGMDSEDPCFVVPFQQQDGWATALSYFDWCVGRLRERGVRVKVHTRQTTEGVVFQLEEEK